MKNCSNSDQESSKDFNICAEFSSRFLFTIISSLSEDEEEPREVMVTRDEITLQSVAWEMHDSIAYVRLAGFRQTSGQELSNALKETINSGAEGIVLDVRDNPGGLLDAAVAIANNFLDGGIVVDVVDSDDAHQQISARRGGVATEIPTVVLVNDASASASEVLAGALQDHGRAKLIGSTTFGKGSVQLIRMLEDGSALHLTTARWLTPLGRPIEGVGLTPDITLEIVLTTGLSDYVDGDGNVNVLVEGDTPCSTPPQSLGQTSSQTI